jgi:hypothetical protein
MKRVSVLLPLGVILLTSCATQRPVADSEPKFHESANADVVIRYYSENISRILKPLQMEGPFLTSFDREGVLDLAKQQTSREMAVVILLQFNASEKVKLSWLTPLKQMGYRRVVFLRAENGRKVDGLSVLENPSEFADGSKGSQDPSVCLLNNSEAGKRMVVH